MKPIIVGAVLVLALACSNPAGPQGGSLTVTRAAPSLELTNGSQAPVYYFAIESGARAYTEWVPCVNSTYCPPLATGDRISLAYSQIVGYFPGAKQAVVFWWHVVPGPADTPQPDSVRAIIVDL